MIIGVPKEVKLDEYRVAMLPVGVEELTRRGHKVLIEVGAGLGSGLADTEYAAAGAELVLEASEIFARADMIVKVKEPQASEWPMIRKGQTFGLLLLSCSCYWQATRLGTCRRCSRAMSITTTSHRTGDRRMSYGRRYRQKR